jgi:hypothetical protein
MALKDSLLKEQLKNIYVCRDRPSDWKKIVLLLDNDQAMVRHQIILIT